jgi:hypothetical protein
LPKHRENRRLIGIVKRGGHLIEHKNRRILEQGSRNGHPLSLSTGQQRASRSHRAVPTERETLDHLVESGRVSGIEKSLSPAIPASTPQELRRRDDTRHGVSAHVEQSAIPRLSTRPQMYRVECRFRLCHGPERPVR